MYHVNTTETAERDILDAAIYIAQTLSNRAAANRLLDKVDTAAASLSQNPTRQPLVKDELLAAKGLRSLPIGNYLLFYVVREKTKCVNVIRFIHSRRDWANLFDVAIFDNIDSEQYIDYVRENQSCLRHDQGNHKIAICTRIPGSSRGERPRPPAFGWFPAFSGRRGRRPLQGFVHFDGKSVFMRLPWEGQIFC